MYVHWQRRTLQVVIELKEDEADQLLSALELLDINEDATDFETRLARNLKELDTSEKWPGV